MLHVLNTSEEAALLGGSNMFLCLPDLSLGSLKNSILGAATVNRAQEIFDRFAQRESYSHGFLVGVINHWIAIVANKYKVPATEDKPEHSEVELLYLDSRNNPILNLNEDELKAIVKDYYDRKDKMGLPVDHRPFREKMYYLSLQDSQFAIELIYECVNGMKNFTSLYVSLCIEGQLANFDNNVVKTDDKDAFFASVLSWLSNVCPPKMVTEQVTHKIKEFGVKAVPDADKRKLLDWIAYVEQRINFNDAEHKIIRKFAIALEEIKTLLTLPKL